MRRRGIQLSPRHKRWFYSVSVLLFLSGAMWMWLDRLARHGGEREELFRSLDAWLLRLHGAAAMAFLVALGILVPTHMRRAWRAHRNRATGAFFVAVMALLVATGYGLYYLGDEDWRSAASWIHLGLGFASPLLLGWHIRAGRREARR